MQSYEDNQKLKRDIREAYWSNNVFRDETPDLVPSSSNYVGPNYRILPDWMEFSRIICLLIGGLGFLFTFINIDQLIHQIPNPFIFNLSLMLCLGGFLSYMVYPYLLSMHVANILNHSRALRYLNGLMLGFSLILLLGLLTIPISGLGLSLILLPAPVSFALSSRKYLQGKVASRPRSHGLPLAVLFDKDLRRLAYLSLIVSFVVLLAVLFFGI